MKKRSRRGHRGADAAGALFGNGRNRRRYTRLVRSNGVPARELSPWARVRNVGRRRPAEPTPRYRGVFVPRRRTTYLPLREPEEESRRIERPRYVLPVISGLPLTEEPRCT
ncbi:hypothetical protein KM043_002834 [Ampulex compressa]|nr:hypothetical protein KM043_002834 [Ampulex compressa]